MALKKTDEIYGKLLSKIGIKSTLLPGADLKEAKKIWSANGLIKPIFKSNVSLAQAILQSTGIKGEIPRYNDRLDSLLTSYLAETIVVPKHQKDVYEDFISVETYIHQKPTKFTITNDNKKTEIVITEDGSNIEITQDVLLPENKSKASTHAEAYKENLAKEIVNSSDKEKIIDNCLFVKLHEDGFMNVTQHTTTAQRTEKNYDGVHQICSLTTTSSSYMEGPNPNLIKLKGYKTYALPKTQETTTIKYVPKNAGDLINSKTLENAIDVIESTKSSAYKTFENIERIYFLKPFKREGYKSNTQFEQDVTNKILQSYSISDASKTAYLISSYKSLEDLKGTSRGIFTQAKEIKNDYTSDEKDILLSYFYPKRFVFTDRAIQNFSLNGHAVIRALTKESGITAEALYQQMNSLISNTGEENLDPNFILVSTFDKAMDSFHVCFTNMKTSGLTSITKKPTEFSVSVNQEDNQVKLDKSFKTNTIVVKNERYDERADLVYSADIPALEATYKLTEVKDASQQTPNFYLGAITKNPYNTEDKNSVCLSDERGHICYQIRNNPITEIISDSDEKLLIVPENDDTETQEVAGVFDKTTFAILDPKTWGVIKKETNSEKVEGVEKLTINEGFYAKPHDFSEIMMEE